MPRADLLVIARSGMVGTELAHASRIAGLDALCLDGPQDIDITNTDAVLRIVRDTSPRFILNAAAYTDVDGAEANTTTADRVNRDGPAALARACAKARATLVHYSTDYVFDGTATTPYTTDHPPSPANAYGRSKLAGEQAIRASGCDHLIIRTSWVYAHHSRNFVRTILALAAERDAIRVVHDQVGRPTYATDLARWTLDLLAAGARGTVHAANDGACTWFDLASAAVRLAALPCRVEPCTTADFPRPAHRPAYGVLDITSASRLIGPLRHWTHALEECIRRISSEPAPPSSSPRSTS